MLEGEVLGNYKLLKCIGSGGMGAVYLAEDTRITRHVAVKVVKSELSLYPDAPEAKAATRLFQREMKAIAALDHPNILPLIDFGEQVLHKGIYTYLVMPYRPEGSLADWLHTHSSTSLPPEEAISLIMQAAEALQHAHDHQIIHLDVKASNFLVHTRQGNKQVPDLLLADFGIARFNMTQSTVSQSIRGTPTAMAPEQWMSQPVTASDQYALAIMAYQLLTETVPFQGRIHQIMYKHIHEIPAPPSSHNPHLAPSIDAILLRALAKKPEERFPSVLTFATALQGVWDESSVTEYLPPPSVATETSEDLPPIATISSSTVPLLQSPPSTQPTITLETVKRSSRWRRVVSVAAIAFLIVSLVTASTSMFISSHSQSATLISSHQPDNGKKATVQTDHIPYGKLLYTTSSPGDPCDNKGGKWSNYNQAQIQCSGAGTTINNTNATSPNLVGTIFTALPADTYPSDYVIEAQVQPLKASSNYGIYFRNQPGSEQGVYTFFLHSDGTWNAYIYSNTNGNQSSLASGKLSVKNSDLLRITVVVAGAEFTFYVNGQFVGKAHDIVYDTGTVGIAADAGGKLLIKSFSLYMLENAKP